MVKKIYEFHGIFLKEYSGIKAILKRIEIGVFACHDIPPVFSPYGIKNVALLLLIIILAIVPIVALIVWLC